MPKVSRISVQKKNKSRYNIFLQEEGKERYAFSVEEETLIEVGLRKGQILDQEMIKSLEKKDLLHKSYNSAINYLSYRMRAIKEVVDYLTEKDTDEEHIEIIIERLKKQKFLDDQAFADAYVSTKMKTSFKGPEQLRKELIHKGVTNNQIDQALSQYSVANQLALIEKWLNKQFKKITKNSHRQTKNKLKQQLLQKGFNHSVIEEAFQLVNVEKNEEEEWYALVYQGERAYKRYRSKAEGYLLIQKIKASLYQKGFNQELIDRFISEYVKEAE